MIFPASVNNRVRENHRDKDGGFVDKQLFAFAEKYRNVSSSSSNAGTFLRGCTQLDPMTYLLFGAYNAVVTERGLECDDWLPIVGKVDIMDDIQTLKTRMEKCFLRVFEGIVYHRYQNQRRNLPSLTAHTPSWQVVQQEEDHLLEEVDESDALAETKSKALSAEEIREFDYLTRDVARILERYSEERLGQSRMASRPGTPSGSGYNTPGGYNSPSMRSSRLQLPQGSGYNSPYMGSRPSTPSNLRTSSYRGYA
jgi:small subunit ribosomal protein S24e